MPELVPYIEEDESGGVLVRIKAVPGSSRDRIAGVLGDRLKVAVSAPPEGGKANRAIAGLLASALGVRTNRVELVSGPSHPEKVFRVGGIEAERAASALSGGGS
ncbi:MAG: DUF167 domain-containing protein [Phycisphaerales bacterium]|nr:MAG: DUF167 domain-containing protein [Phycisphaerales bacterium]